MFACTHVCVPCLCLVLVKALHPWNWSYRLWWVLGMESGSSVRSSLQSWRNAIFILLLVISPSFKIHIGSFRESHRKRLLLEVFNLSSLFSGESTGLWLPLLSGMYLCLEFVAWQQSEQRGRNKGEPLGEVVECFKMGHRGTGTLRSIHLSWLS